MRSGLNHWGSVADPGEEANDKHNSLELVKDLKSFEDRIGTKVQTLN